MRLPRRRTSAALAAALLPVLRSAHAEDAAEATPEDEHAKAYTAPSVEGLHWAETFDGDVMSRWSHSAGEKYNGKFSVEKRTTEALVGDVGLLVPEEAKHYGIATTFPGVEGQPNVPFVLQFETKFQKDLTCGGSYLKLFNSEGKKAEEFHSDTPYVIMFGPDRCGSTDKVHFILRHKNPKTGEWEEKHAQDVASVPRDQNSHLYGLVIKPDNSYQILIDGVQKATGSLLENMQPPVNPPKEIDDPADGKPQDWVDEKKIDDPESKKPDDWDEEAPAKIQDPEKLQPPAGWREDLESRIADPSAKKPDDWDDEEDGEWEAPVIDNPECTVGCGKYAPPTISNPAYKGKWYAPKIENPAYIGEWKPRQIENPNYFYDETPYILPKIDSVGIDIWTMSSGIMFDNMVISTDVAKAEAFTEKTFTLRKSIEELQKPKASGGIWDTVSENPVPLALVVVVIALGSIWFCCLRSSGGPPPPPAAKAKPAAKKKAAEKAEDKKDDKENEKKNDEGEKEDKDEAEKKDD
eukprot:TRINITY_DN102594_c0_g1_i1.p1 TRINITY_DN102594_c0_g1~~TRINITY_DN102594_c0_g1_i1.p1  ORF type:complete len:548 (+),score=173.11 TRINITY_DN102594_c0_g1_i1:80-1645(+)